MKRNWDNAITMGANGRKRSARPRRALILPVILVILLLLALLSASFSFQVQADYSAGRAAVDHLQARLSAEAGIHAAMHRLRTDMDDPSVWFSNPEAFDQALVWSPSATPEELGKGTTLRPDEATEESVVDENALRFSLVADDPTDTEDKLDEGMIRFGLTDEASKININVATSEQLLALIQPVVIALGYEETAGQELVDALIDWRDADDEPTSETKPAEAAYYATLQPPYRAKNAPFETVEELLMVRGFNGRILYGEDYDRNGLLSGRSEDDGEDVFPNDNADGVLERGIYPFITVWSQEYNLSSDNKPRFNLFQSDDIVKAKLPEIFERNEVVSFIRATNKRTGTERIRSLADFLEPKIINDSLTAAPFTGEEIEILFDKCTIDGSPQRQGLINVNTAPARVLRAVGIPQDLVTSIISTRQTLPAAQRKTTAWLITKAGMTADLYAELQNVVTSRSRQFTIESIGFSDMRGIFARLQAVVVMRGPVPQLIYLRDITRLGMGFPVRGKEGERRFALHAE